MCANNGNGKRSGLDDPRESPTIQVDVVTKFKNFAKFTEAIHEQSLSDVGSMILHIHPKFIEIEKDPFNNRFKVIINMDEEEINA